MNYPRSDAQGNGLDGRRYKDKKEELNHWIEQHPQTDYWRVPSYLRLVLKQEYGDIRTAKMRLRLIDKPKMRK